MKLYDLTANVAAIYNRVLDDDADLAVLEDTLQSLEGAIEVKAENMAKFVLMLNADADAIDSEIKRLQARKAARLNRAERIKAYLKNQLEFIGKDKVQTPLMTVAIRKNPPSLVIDDVAAIPTEYLTMIPARFEPTKELIKESLKAGNEVPGAHLEQGTHLRIL